MFDLPDPGLRVRTIQKQNRRYRGDAYPDIEVEVFVVYGLDVEAYSWNRRYDLANLPEYSVRVANKEQ